MRKIRACAWLAGWILAAQLQAAYTLTPLVGGQSNPTVHPGDSFTVDFVLSSDASDLLTAPIFTAQFSKAGLTYTGHAWATPFLTSSGDNKTVPGATTTTTLAAGTYVAGFADPGAVDVYFENFLGAGNFTTGTLVSINLSVPADYATGPLMLTPVPDTFSNDLGDVVTVAGTPLTIDVIAVPEPMLAGVLLPAAVLLLRRRPA